jgi:hypothetical protein
MSASLIGRLGSSTFRLSINSSVDVAHGLALLFGLGTKALPSWDSKTRWNNLMGDLAVTVTAGSSRHTNSPHPSSREGPHSTVGWISGLLLSREPSRFGRAGGSDHRADTRDRHQAPAHIIVPDDGQQVKSKPSRNVKSLHNARGLSAIHPPESSTRFREDSQKKQPRRSRLCSSAAPTRGSLELRFSVRMPRMIPTAFQSPLRKGEEWPISRSSPTA